MPITYDNIATTTLSSAATAFTFSSIPATYTDLKIVLNAVDTSANSAAMRFTFNADSGSNYSNTQLEGNGTSASSGRTTNIVGIYSASTALNAANSRFFIEADIFSYAGSIFKTILLTNSADDNGQGIIGKIVGTWRSTSAITSVTLTKEFGGQFGISTIATLYGIKNA